MAKVIVGMSGGVDSSVAAYLLKESGYDVIGVTLRTWNSGEGSRCCEIDEARKAAYILGIPYYALNRVENFRRLVVEPFVGEYVKGFTPNPCIGCNPHVKWEGMLHAAKIFDADYVATGHYASVIKKPEGYTLKKALHGEKDQTYMLYRLTQEQLAATLMPLGGMSKDDVRGIAAEVGIPAASLPDSQEICFVTNGSYADYIEANAGDSLPGEGRFVDEEGNVLGTHKGITHYTVGQRKGLGLALGSPVYVKEIRAESNEVVLGKKESLLASSLICDDVCLMRAESPEPGEEISCEVKIRYRSAATSGVVKVLPGNRAAVIFREPVSAAAPGQSAVFYDREDCVVGGGIIREVIF